MTDVASFAEIGAEFQRRIRKTVWATLTTVDARGRPRGRLVHPIWEGPTGWLATGRHSFKAGHLAANPYVSLAYWDADHEQAYVECRAEWVDDAAEKLRLWEMYGAAPEPLGYDLGAFWKGGPEDPEYGLLRFDPWRLELWSLEGLFTGTAPQVWRP